MTLAPAWADAEWSPFGVALEPVYEPAIEFGTAAVYTDAESFLASLDNNTAGHNLIASECLVTDAPLTSASEKCEACAVNNNPDCLVGKPELDDTGAPVIEWAPATREQLGDGDTVRVTQVGRWKGTRLVGKVTTYEKHTTTS